MDQKITPLTARDFKESEHLLGKVHELSGRWNSTRSHGSIDNETIGELTGEYIEAVNKAYAKLNENVIKIASLQTKV